MARGCGCAGGQCDCNVMSDDLDVQGTGTANDPYTINHKFNGVRVPAFATGDRPSASSVPEGTMIFNATTNIPNWSDGASWRNASGTVV